MRRAARRWRCATNAGAALVSAVILVWTLTPIYNIIMVSLESDGDVAVTTIWPAQPSAESFWVVLTEGHWYLEAFWHQFGNSVFLAGMVTLLVLFIGSLTSFSISRMRICNGWMITNAALLTYVIPGSFLAIPFYLIMKPLWYAEQPVVGDRRVDDLHHPLCDLHLPGVWQKHTPRARRVGADRRRSPVQIYFRIYLPLMAPALVAVGTYALLAAWNEYLYQFLLLSNDRSMTVAVALGKFLNSDVASWNYMMATAIIYALPPLATYYLFRRRMSSGLTMGGVKG
jgi:multiple sugar transport system permease protein